MKTFLKVVLLSLLALLALKLLPLTFGLACLLAAGLIGFIVIGFSAVVAVLGAAIALAAVLSPIWVPVLVILGIVSLSKRSSHRPPTISA